MADAREVAELLRARDRFLLLGHVNPDGDVVGCLLALSSALRELGKAVGMVLGGPVPAAVRFLPGADELDRPAPCDTTATVVAVDCTDVGRLPEECRDLSDAPLVINVDHHACNKLFGHVNYIDDSSVAAGEQIWLILRELGVSLDPDRAACLYAAIATDSGMFRYEGTSGRTHRIVAELLEAGVDAREMAERLLQTRTYEEAVLLGRALSKLRRSPDGRIAWMVLSRSDLTLDGRPQRCPEGCADYARDVIGVEVAACLREEPPGVRVSLRSRGRVDVNRIAQRFGGGGHSRAAGCTLTMSLEEATRKIIEALEAALRDK